MSEKLLFLVSILGSSCLDNFYFVFLIINVHIFIIKKRKCLSCTNCLSMFVLILQRAKQNVANFVLK